MASGTPADTHMYRTRKEADKSGDSGEVLRPSMRSRSSGSIPISFRSPGCDLGQCQKQKNKLQSIEGNPMSRAAPTLTGQGAVTQSHVPHTPMSARPGFLQLVRVVFRDVALSPFFALRLPPHPLGEMPRGRGLCCQASLEVFLSLWGVLVHPWRTARKVWSLTR